MRQLTIVSALMYFLIVGPSAGYPVLRDDPTLLEVQEDILDKFDFKGDGDPNEIQDPAQSVPDTSNIDTDDIRSILEAHMKLLQQQGQDKRSRRSSDEGSGSTLLPVDPHIQLVEEAPQSALVATDVVEVSHRLVDRMPNFPALP